MRTSRRYATFVAGIFALGLLFLGSGAPVLAQSSSKSVVVIDIGKVFKEHLRFKQQMEVLKKDMEAFQAYIRNEQTKLQERAEKAQGTFAKGSDAYKKEEEALTRQRNELQLQAATKQRDIMDREAKVYFNVYNEITKEVADFAAGAEISLVLRYNSDPINPDDRNSVLQAVNNSIIYQNKLDITNHIIKRVNIGTATARKPSGGGTQIPRTRTE